MTTTSPPSGSPPPQEGRQAIQRRTVALLSVVQVLSGVGMGATVTVGSLLAAQLAGTAWAGSMTTVATLGTALAAMPLARLAMARGRRTALSAGLALAAFGSITAIAAATWGSFLLLLVAGVLMGLGGAVNLQARFAATDLSEARHRGRDLSLVVWMTMVGAVAGPNLLGAGAVVAGWLGLPELSGIFIFSTTGMLLAMVVLLVGLRPDPYLLAQRDAAASAAADAGADAVIAQPGVPGRQSLRASFADITSRPIAAAGLLAIVCAHAVMVGVMSMTPVHLAGHGASVTIIGLTISLHIAGMYALSPLMGLLSDRIGSKAVVLGGLATLVAAVLLAGLGDHQHAAVTAGLILLGIGWSAASVAGSVLVVDGVPPSARLGTQGLSDALMSLAGAAAAASAGLVLAALGYLGLNLVAGALVVVVAAAFLRLLATHKGA